MSTTQFILLITMAILLDLMMILWLRRRNRRAAPPGPQPAAMGQLTADGKAEMPNEGIPVISGESDGGSIPEKKSIPSPLLLHAASALKSFPGIPLRLPVGDGLDILIISVVTLLYAYPLLISHTGLGLPGNEYQAHVGAVTLFNQWLAGETGFPLWNPVVGTGRTLIADPFLFFFNPFTSLPMAIFGVINGSKVAVVLHFFIAGLGMWLVTRELKFGRMTRLWCILLYMMSGAIPAHLNEGYIQLAFALGWLPWSVAGLLWVIKRSSLLAILCASLAQALFFFAGNLYYQVYAFFYLLVLSFGFAFEWKPFRLKWNVARRILLMAFLSLGLISIQLLPQLTSTSDVRNMGGYLPDETEYGGSQRPENAILNYFVSDQEFYRNPTLDKAPYLQESYRYIGVVPFLLLLFLIPAF